jgi:hypothetical protein
MSRNLLPIKHEFQDLLGPIVKINKLYTYKVGKICGSHSGRHEECCFLWCDALKFYQTTRRQTILNWCDDVTVVLVKIAALFCATSYIFLARVKRFR